MGCLIWPLFNARPAAESGASDIPSMGLNRRADHSSPGAAGEMLPVMYLITGEMRCTYMRGNEQHVT